MKIMLNIPYLYMKYPFEIDDSATVERVKTLIEEGCEIPISQQELFCGSTELKNEQNITEICNKLNSFDLFMYPKNLTQESVINNNENKEKEGEDLEIKIFYNHNAELSVWINKSYTVLQLKESIWAQHKIPINEQKIVHSGRTLDNKIKFSDLDSKIKLQLFITKKEEKNVIKNNVTQTSLDKKEEGEKKGEELINNREKRVSNLFKMKGTDDPRPIENTKKEGEDFLITIRYDGKDLYLWINKSYSLAQLKESLRDQHKIPVEGQKIIYCGRALNDKENLTVLKFDDLKNPPKLNLSFAKKEEKNVIKDNLNHTLLGGSNSPPEEKEVKKDFRNKI